MRGLAARSRWRIASHPEHPPICTVDSISWLSRWLGTDGKAGWGERGRASTRRANNWPESRGSGGIAPEVTPPRGILILHRKVISSSATARGVGGRRGVRKKRRGFEGKLRKDNILPYPFWVAVSRVDTWHPRKPAKFALIVPRIGFGGLRQRASWKMLRPYILVSPLAG